MKQQDEGFTLIELLIVIVILGILATVVVFAVSGIRDQGDQSACETELRSVLTAIEAYYAEEGDYPADDAGITPYFRNDLQYWGVAAAADGTVTAVADPATVTAGDPNCG